MVIGIDTIRVRASSKYVPFYPAIPNLANSLAWYVIFANVSVPDFQRIQRDKQHITILLKYSTLHTPYYCEY